MVFKIFEDLLIEKLKSKFLLASIKKLNNIENPFSNLFRDPTAAL
jgi:hypothetical protein